MKAIRFSHDYEKLPKVWEGTQAVLLQVKHIPDMDSFMKRFPQLIRSDTKIRDVDEYYPIHFRAGIFLIFLHINSGSLFSTIRSFDSGKFGYYFLSIDETFVLERSGR